MKLEKWNEVTEFRGLFRNYGIGCGRFGKLWEGGHAGPGDRREYNMVIVRPWICRSVTTHTKIRCLDTKILLT